MKSAAEKEKALSQLATDIVNDTICPQLAQTAKQLVMGEGNVDAEVVFIGEAPGKKEDELGIPFVGAAGKFLDEMLLEAGLGRQDVYITNIVKYRPPDNRDPSPEEKQAFTPVLDKQLAIIEPKIVVTLGRHAMEHFLPGRKISEVHGRAFRKKMPIGSGKHGVTSGIDELASDHTDRSIVFLPLYHPAAALYNGSLRQTLVDDFKKIPTILAEIN